MNQIEAFSIDISESDYGERLDILVSTHLCEQSRKRISVLIKDGYITVSGEKKKPGYKIKPGDKVSGSIPFMEPHSAQPEKIDLDIIYDDNDIVVINKKADIVVHPAPGNYSGTIVNALLYHYPELKKEDNDLRPGIVHRLDKDTTGVMVIAKTPLSQAKLSESFKERTVSKSYLAVVHGKTGADGRVDIGIGRHTSDRKKMSVHGKNLKNAVTNWKTVENFPLGSLIECNIETGRTHQIRVHCAYIKHHIFGDPVYGLTKKESTEPFRSLLQGIGRQMLHARKLVLTHPVTGKEMEFTAEVPDDMRGMIERLRL